MDIITIEYENKLGVCVPIKKLGDNIYITNISNEKRAELKELNNDQKKTVIRNLIIGL